MQNPPNYQLVADELLPLHGLKRARPSVEAYVKTHFSHLLPSSPKKPGTYRRFRRAHIGELWQHDSSIHQWWPAERKQRLQLTVDDHSGEYPGQLCRGRYNLESLSPFSKRLPTVADTGDRLHRWVEPLRCRLSG